MQCTAVSSWFRPLMTMTADLRVALGDQAKQLLPGEVRHGQIEQHQADLMLLRAGP